MSNVLEEVHEIYEPSPELLSVMMGSRTPILLSIDIGTSGVRAALFDDCGNEIPGRHVRTNAHNNRLADHGATDANLLVSRVVHTIDELLATFPDTNSPIEMIAVSCFWHSLMGVDAMGQPTTPVFSWSDRRATRAASKLRSDYDEATFHSRTGCRFHPSYWPAKLLRLRIDEPETFRATGRWLSFSDYLASQLFGQTATSVSMASATGLMDQMTCNWDPELVRALGLSQPQLPEIASNNQTFGELSNAYAQRWPQLAAARMFPAIGDGAANNIGAGCTTRDKIALMIGTSGAMRVMYEGLPPANVPSELWCYRADRQRAVVGGALSDGGSVYRWIRESLLPNEDADSIEDQLTQLPPDEHGLTVLPFWSGERSPGWNANARGSILGISMRTRPIEILRAAMEAVAYRFALIAQALEPLAPGASIMASGHALRSSAAWVQILADVLGRQINVSELGEASTRGAALLALQAAGKIQNIDSFTVPIEAVFEPDMSRHARYQVALERQQQMYQRVILKTRPRIRMVK